MLTFRNFVEDVDGDNGGDIDDAASQYDFDRINAHRASQEANIRSDNAITKDDHKKAAKAHAYAASKHETASGHFTGIPNRHDRLAKIHQLQANSHYHLSESIEIKPEHKGLFHKDTHTAAGKKIPLKKEEDKLHSSSKAVRRRAQFAINARHWHHESVNEEFEYHNQLNPSIWNGFELKSEVQSQLLHVAEHFADSLDQKIMHSHNLKIVDIVLTGSNANFNWTNLSDLDVHLVVDFKGITKNQRDTTLAYFNAQRRLWNSTHRVTANGFTIEVYVQDVKEPHISTGVYSLKNHKWIHQPSHKAPTVDHSVVQAKAESLAHDIDAAPINRLAEIQGLHRKITDYRRSGLQSNGEFSVENLVFKSLRNSGHLATLQQKLLAAEDASLSLN